MLVSSKEGRILNLTQKWKQRLLGASYALGQNMGPVCYHFENVKILDLLPQEKTG